MNEQRESGLPTTHHSLLPTHYFRMSEAEVSLRLAFWLVREKHVSGDDNNVFVAIDVRVGGAGMFDVAGLLRENHWRKADSTEGWRGTYAQDGAASRLVIDSASGKGDVVCRLQDGRVLRVKAKTGSLTNSRSSEEYRLLQETLGQLLMLEDVSKKDVLAIAVPYSPRFTKLAERRREAPLIKQLGILILTVGRDGQVDGLSPRGLETFRKQQGSC